MTYVCVDLATPDTILAVARHPAADDDETGAFIRDSLESEGVDVSDLAVAPRRRSPQSEEVA